MLLSARLFVCTAILSTVLVLSAADEASAPVIELPPENMTALVGEEVILECVAVGTPTPTITWLSQGQPLVNDTGRLQVLDTGALMIDDVKESDTGNYSCVAANDGGQATAEASLIVVGKAQAPVIQFSEGSIRAGVGYSTDKEQIVSQACYNVESTHSAEQQAIIKLDTAMSYGELESQIGASVSVKGSYGMFSADASANYMRTLKDKDYSTSLNYFAKYTSKVTVQLAGGGKEKGLTETGRSHYKNIKFFGLVCGDEYVASYEQGVFLTMGINIIFSNSESKQKFDASVSGSYGNMVSASANISGFVNENKIRGSVIIQALQIGGEPSLLSQVLSKDGNGNFYALTCSLAEMQNCIKASSGLLNYARDELPKQFSFGKNTGLTPVGLGTTQYNPADEIGIETPPSVVTPEIESIREDLSDKYLENDYYKQKLYPLLDGNGYPKELDEGFKNKARALFNKVDRNIRTLLRPHGGAADCFNKPLQCKALKKKIDRFLEPVTKNDLSFLESIKYTGFFEGFRLDQNKDLYPFIPDGRNVPWHEHMYNAMKALHGEYWQVTPITNVREENLRLKFNLFMSYPEKMPKGYVKGIVMYTYEGVSEAPRENPPQWNYKGIMTSGDRNFTEMIIKKVSPFYFEAYKSSR